MPISGCNSPSRPGSRKGASKPCNGTTQPCPATAKVKITSIRLTSFEFTTDHQKILDNTVNWQGTGNRYPKPEWKEGRSNPSPIGISHNRGQKVKVKIEFEVKPSNATSVTGEIKGSGGGGYLQFLEKTSLSGGKHSATLTSMTKLPDIVAALKGKRIRWKVTADGQTFNIGKVGQYNLYLTHAPPHNSTSYDNTVTEKRMEWVCTTCSGDTAPHESVKKIHDKTGSFDLSASIPIPRWRIAGGTSAQCMDLSKFYQLAAEMLGLSQGNVSLPDPSITRDTGSGEVVYLYPQPGKTTKESASGNDCVRRAVASSTPPHPSPTTHDDYLAHEEVLLVDGSGGWNNFEACYKYQQGGTTKYYAGGAGIESTKQQVMESVCQRTDWTYKALGGWSVCTNPGPSPIDTW